MGSSSAFWSDILSIERLDVGYYSSDSDYGDHDNNIDDGRDKKISKTDGEYIYKYKNNDNDNDKIIRRKSRYKNGVKHKKQYRYFSNGNPSIIENYKNGKLHLKQHRYFENGKKAQIKTYKNGIENGLQISYHQNGYIKTIKTMVVHRNGYCKSITYRSDKSISEIMYFYMKTKVSHRMTFNSAKRLDSYVVAFSKNNISYMHYIGFSYGDDNKLYVANTTKYKKICIDENKSNNYEPYGKEFSYYQNGVLKKYYNHNKKGIRLCFYQDRTIKSITYCGNNSFENIRFLRNGVKNRHDLCITEHDNAITHEYANTHEYVITHEYAVTHYYLINTEFKIILRFIQKKYRRRYNDRIYYLFKDSTNIIKPLFDLIIEYTFKLNNINTIDHSLLHIC
jgi:antitoxin component YwqK of YwqJK toxin-antitoxin module